MAYGERMRARLALRAGAQPIAGARIYFGPGEQASIAGVDYWIGGQLEQLSLTEWQGFSRRWGAGRSAPFRIPEDLSIDVSVAKLEGLGFVFKDLRLRAKQENRRWRIDTDGPDARGSIRLPGAHPGGMLEASFTRLKLVPSARGGIPEKSLTRAACPRSQSRARTSLMARAHWAPCGCAPTPAPRA